MPQIHLRLDNWSKVFLISSALAMAIQAGLLLAFLPKLPPEVPLFYSLPWGEDRLVTPIWLWALPAVSGIFLVINLAGSHLLNEIVLTRILSSTSFLISLLALVTLIKIILLGLP
jgi:hypothetical protein